MDALLAPRSIAVVGASADETKISGKILPALLRGGFQGTLHAVNRARTEIRGMPCHSSIEDVEEEVDLALLAVPLEQIEAAVNSCVRKEVRALTIYTGGFGESGPQGLAKEQYLRELSRATGIRILGPNCQGFLVPAVKVCTTFNGVLAQEDMRTPGHVAWVAQSGAIGGIAVSLLRQYGLGLSLWVSTGNECDVDFCAIVDYALEDPNTTIVCGYVENIRTVSTFREVATKALFRGKPIVLVKGGQSERGAAAARSHTGAIVGDRRVYEGLFRQHGVILVDSLEEMAATAALFDADPHPKTGRCVGILGNSGGTGVLLADQCATAGLIVPPVTDAVVRQMQSFLPAFITPSNPVDIPMLVRHDPVVLRRCIQALGAQEQAPDAYIVCLHSVFQEDGYALAGIVDALRQAQISTDRPVILISYGSDPGLADLGRKASVPVLGDGPRAVQALANSWWWGRVRTARMLDERMEGWLHVAEPLAPPQSTAGGAFDGFGEDRIKRLLGEHGIPVPEGCCVTSEHEAKVAADDIGYPVAMKLVTPHVAHKTDVGAVELSVGNGDEAAMAYRRLLRVARSIGSTAGVRVLVEAMAPPGRDLVVSLRKDEVFGWVLMLGIGGAAVEALDDIVTRLVPVSPDEALRMVDELKLRRLLGADRGTGPIDLPWLKDFLMDLQSLIARCDWLTELELNPVRVYPKDGGGVVLDALASVTSNSLVEGSR